MLNRIKIVTVAAAMIVAYPLFAQPSFAQSDLDNRVEKLEKEVRAVQRKVFPQGSDRFFEPEIRPDSAQPTTSRPTNNDNAAVRDLLGRVNALEEQLANLTGQLEQQQFKMRSVENKIAALEKGLKAQQDAAASEPTATLQTTAPVSSPSPTPPVSSARRDAVAAIELPDTGNAFDDSYNYGFRLWEAKFYPEAQVQLQSTVDTYPTHPRASFARNLLGRAWLDDNKPTTAAKIFYDNYKDDPRGARAPDSLYFLGAALSNMSEFAKACEAYGELEGAYPDIASGRLADRLSRARSTAKC